jgi:hypothetical protein
VLDNANLPLPKIGQGVIPEGLQTLLFHLSDMHTLTLKNEEVMRYPIGLSVKGILEIF